MSESCVLWLWRSLSELEQLTVFMSQTGLETLFQRNAHLG